MYSDFDREVSEARIEQERDAQIAAARKALRQMGTEDCVECGRPIPLARRRAHPPATHCVECLELVEKEASRK